jgi:hypothetical protein
VVSFEALQDVAEEQINRSVQLVDLLNDELASAAKLAVEPELVA